MFPINFVPAKQNLFLLYFYTYTVDAKKACLMQNIYLSCFILNNFIAKLQLYLIKNWMTTTNEEKAIYKRPS